MPKPLPNSQTAIKAVSLPPLNVKSVGGDLTEKLWETRKLVQQAFHRIKAKTSPKKVKAISNFCHSGIFCQVSLFIFFFSRNVKHPYLENKENTSGAEKLQTPDSVPFYRNLPTHVMELHKSQ